MANTDTFTFDEQKFADDMQKVDLPSQVWLDVVTYNARVYDVCSLAFTMDATHGDAGHNWSIGAWLAIGSGVILLIVAGVVGYKLLGAKMAQKAIAGGVA